MTNKLLSFWVTLLYVLLATVYSYCSYHPAASNGLLFLVFFPAQIFPSLIIFTEREPGFLILICQTITFLILWPFTWGLLNLLRKKK